MSDVPYDAVRPVSIGLLSNVTLGPFLNTAVLLKKRQILSNQATASTSELLQMCPLNDIQGSHVAAGCIAGIYNHYCYNPLNSTLLSQCHDAYNRAFGASIFKSLGDVCPAWKNGPRSASCVIAIKNFQYHYVDGDRFSVILNYVHAQELVSNIFAQPKYAPCQAPVHCIW
jgi:hypothetical protein